MLLASVIIDGIRYAFAIDADLEDAAFAVDVKTFIRLIVRVMLYIYIYIYIYICIHISASY